MLNYEIWGNSVQTWIVSLLIIAGAFIVVKLLSLLGRTLLGLLCRLCGLLCRGRLSLGNLGLRRFRLGGFRLPWSRP